MRVLVAALVLLLIACRPPHQRSTVTIPPKDAPVTQIPDASMESQGGIDRIVLVGEVLLYSDRAQLTACGLNQDELWKVPLKGAHWWSEKGFVWLRYPDRLVCLDLESGNSEGEMPYYSRRPMRIVRVDRLVVLHESEYELVSFPEGNTIWRGQRPPNWNRWDEAVELAYNELSVFVTQEEAVYAYSLADGHRRWRHDAKGAGPPVVHEDNLYYTTVDEVVALNANNGVVRWRSKSPPRDPEMRGNKTSEGFSHPVVDNDWVYVSEIFVGPAGSSQRFVLGLKASGEASFGPWVTNPHYPFQESGLVLSPDGMGGLSAFELGQTRDSWTIPFAYEDYRYRIHQIREELVFLSDDVFKALNRQTGETVWSAGKGEVPIFGETPDDKVLLKKNAGPRTVVVARNPVDGEVLWEQTLEP